MTLVTYGDVRTWRAAPLGQAGDALGRDVRALEQARDTLETQTVPDSWSGIARFFALTRRSGLLSRMDSHVEGKRQVQRGLFDAETRVASIERLVEDVESQARTQGFEIGVDGTVTDGTGFPDGLDTFGEIQDYFLERGAIAADLADQVSTIIAAAQGADAAIANAIPSGHVEQIDEYGSIDPEVAERWAELSDDERRAIVEQLIEEQAEASGIDDPRIVWEPEDWDSNGQWSEDDGGTIHLNEGLLDDPRILHTVPHEIRHGRQHEAIDDANDRFHFHDPFDEHRDDGITEDQVDEWEDNFDDYQDSEEDGYENYFEQPVEDDARETGSDYVDDLTEEELDRLLEDAG